MLRSRSFVSFMSTIAALGGSALLAAACGPGGAGTLCCCNVGANNIRNCTPSTQQGCIDGVLESCASVGMGGNGPDEGTGGAPEASASDEGMR